VDVWQHRGVILGSCMPISRAISGPGNWARPQHSPAAAAAVASLNTATFQTPWSYLAGM
jgi:hypothetical protein